MAKMRLDALMVERGLAENRSIAQRLVMSGRVRVDGQSAFKPGMSVPTEADLNVTPGEEFVSRGGEKIKSALQAFNVDIRGMICADVGASTGGFTDCLLQHGAAKVYAIDVGHGILAWTLRQDPRVVVMERRNARYIDCLPEPVNLITVDVSFISLKLLLPVFKGWFKTSPLNPEEQEVRGSIIALIKPQFEAGRTEVRRGQGVIRDPQVHRQVLSDVLGFAQQESYDVKGLIRSPLLGPKGNSEFLAWLTYPATAPEQLTQLIDQVIPD